MRTSYGISIWRKLDSLVIANKVVLDSSGFIEVPFDNNSQNAEETKRFMIEWDRVMTDYNLIFSNDMTKFKISYAKP